MTLTSCLSLLFVLAFLPWSPGTHRTGLREALPPAAPSARVPLTSPIPVFRKEGKAVNKNLPSRLAVH